MPKRNKAIAGSPSIRPTNPFQRIAAQLGVSVTTAEKAGHGDKKAQQKLTDSQRGVLTNFVQDNRGAIDAYKKR